MKEYYSTRSNLNSIIILIGILLDTKIRIKIKMVYNRKNYNEITKKIKMINRRETSVDLFYKIKSTELENEKKKLENEKKSVKDLNCLGLNKIIQESKGIEFIINKLTKKNLEDIKDSFINNENIKKIDFTSKFIHNILDGCFHDDGCIIINEIMKKSKLEAFLLGSKIFLKIGNEISYVGLSYMKHNINNIKCIDLYGIIFYNIVKF
jgi:hypothetical protein